MIEIQTESGSTYIFDTKEGTWERTKKGDLFPPSSVQFYTARGIFTSLEDIEVGKRGTIHAPGLEFGYRWIHTSLITSKREY